MLNIDEVERRSRAEISVEVGRANEVDSVERAYYNRGNQLRVNCRTSGYSFVGRDEHDDVKIRREQRTRKDKRRSCDNWRCGIGKDRTRTSRKTSRFFPTLIAARTERYVLAVISALIIKGAVINSS